MYRIKHNFVCGATRLWTISVTEVKASFRCAKFTSKAIAESNDLLTYVKKTP